MSSLEPSLTGASAARVEAAKNKDCADNSLTIREIDFVSTLNIFIGLSRDAIKFESMGGLEKLQQKLTHRRPTFLLFWLRQNGNFRYSRGESIRGSNDATYTILVNLSFITIKLHSLLCTVCLWSSSNQLRSPGPPRYIHLANAHPPWAARHCRRAVGFIRNGSCRMGSLWK